MTTEAVRAAWPLAVDSAPLDPLVAALRHIARFVSSTLELREVFTRVAEAAATVLPLDFMGVVRVKGPDALETATSAAPSACARCSRSRCASTAGSSAR
ncbi:MAG TPA: hypothetical protein VGP73_24945 [Thermoanaerobaculia bacterium]